MHHHIDWSDPLEVAFLDSVVNDPQFDTPEPDPIIEPDYAQLSGASDADTVDYDGGDY